MGKSEIRYAAKVDLEKDAASQPQLHVRIHTLYTTLQARLTLLRTAGTPTVPLPFPFLPSQPH